MARKSGSLTSGGRLSAAQSALAAFAALLFLASCATVPKRTSSEWMGTLPSDASLYASLSVPGSAALIKKALKDAGPGVQDLGTLIDRTTRMVASVTIVPGSPARYSVIALGNYPSGIIGARLSGNKEWQRKKGSAGAWWEWTKSGLQMSIPNNGILLASSGEVEGLLSRWTAPLPLAIPAEVASDMETKDFVLYMPELPGGLPQNAQRAGVHIPIREVWIYAVHASSVYTVTGTANTSSEQEAKLLALVLRLGIAAWMRTEKVSNVVERLKTLTGPTPTGVQVKMAGLQVTEDELIPLFLSLVKGMGTEPAPGTDQPQ